MQYMGGKSRLSNDISKIINDNCGNKFVSLFCGTCAIESKIKCGSKVLNDAHEYLMELLTAVQNGYDLPDQITKDDYYYVKENKDMDKALTGFVGFGCSFGGKWFGGYAKNNSGTNYAKQSKNSLMKKMKTLSRETTTFTNKDYRDVYIPNDAVVYCDPPYANTTKYTNSNNFNHDDFWGYVRELSKSNIVFVSELSAPNDFVAVWEKPFKRVLDSNKNNIFESKECLFVHLSVVDKLNK